MFLRRLYALGLLLVAAAFGQTGNTVVDSSYSLPAPINAAPGQILNLSVVGIGAGLTGRVSAPSLPLPNSLAGISVQLTQIATPQSVPVPILAVRPVSTCPSGPSINSSPCGRYTVVTVQIPYEMAPACPYCASPVLSSAQLVVSENGVPGGAVALNPEFDNIHVANSCDLDSAATTPCTPAPLVTHADGSLVTATSPARIGEEIAIYALGLGATNPPAQTGHAAPSPSPMPIYLDGVIYTYGLNAPPTRGIPAPFAACALGTGCPIAPAFAGLTPGTVGLYQVNVVVPPSDNVFQCGVGVTTNLTISIVGATSFDGAAICVAQP